MMSDGRTTCSAQAETNRSFQVRGNRTPIKPIQLHILKKGDHVAWHRPYIIWHHAIVIAIYTRNNEIQVIHFTKKDGNYTVVLETIDVTKQNHDFFRFNYSTELCLTNLPDVVLARALNRLGEAGYNFLKNNCEHFAAYCKTGKEYCAQVHWGIGKLIASIETCVINAVCTGVKQVGCVLKKNEKQSYRFIAKIGGAEAVELISKASNWVGAGMVAAIEIVHCGYDIYQLHKNKKAGKIFNQDFKQCVTERISEGVFSGGAALGSGFAGGKLGGVIGGVIGSVIPVVGTATGVGVGTFVGSVAGGFLGSVLGKACGLMFGHWLGRNLYG